MNRAHAWHSSLLLFAYGGIAPTNNLRPWVLGCGCVVAARERPEKCPVHEAQAEKT